jgi:hypothetical protein
VVVPPDDVELEVEVEVVPDDPPLELVELVELDEVEADAMLPLSPPHPPKSDNPKPHANAIPATILPRNRAFFGRISLSPVTAGLLRLGKTGIACNCAANVEIDCGCSANQLHQICRSL